MISMFRTKFILLQQKSVVNVHAKEDERTSANTNANMQTEIMLINQK